MFCICTGFHIPLFPCVQLSSRMLLDFPLHPFPCRPSPARFLRSILHTFSIFHLPRMPYVPSSLCFIHLLLVSLPSSFVLFFPSVIYSSPELVLSSLLPTYRVYPIPSCAIFSSHISSLSSSSIVLSFYISRVSFLTIYSFHSSSYVLSIFFQTFHVFHLA